MANNEDLPEFLNLIGRRNRPKVLILVITDAGSYWESTFLNKIIFKYKCLDELFHEVRRRKVLISFVTRGSVLHKELVKIYGIDVAPLIMLIDTNTGKPIELTKIDRQRESYCALSLSWAVSVALKGDSARYSKDIIETYDKGVNTTGKIPSRHMAIDNNACQVEVGDYEYVNTTRDVATQYNFYRSEKPRMLPTPCTNIATYQEETKQQVKPTDAVWTIERTSPLPFGAVSRLQILLPNRSPAHVAVSELATMMDVCRFVSGILNTPSNSLEISSRYPYHIFTEDEMLKTVCNLGLTPTAVLIITVNTELAKPSWTLANAIHNLMATVTKPFVAVLSGFWSRVQSIFYSSSEEDADGDKGLPPRRPKKRHSNVRTLWDEDDDDNDDSKRTLPSYNGNSTLLL